MGNDFIEPAPLTESSSSGAHYFSEVGLTNIGELDLSGFDYAHFPYNISPKLGAGTALYKDEGDASSLHNGFDVFVDSAGNRFKCLSTHKRNPAGFLPYFEMDQLQGDASSPMALIGVVFGQLVGMSDARRMRISRDGNTWATVVTFPSVKFEPRQKWLSIVQLRG